MSSDVVLFFGKTNPEFSNFYIAPFERHGRVYPSVEHYFMWMKAKTFDKDGDVIKKMSNDLTPAQIKKLGRQVKHFDASKWDDFGKSYMFHALFEKFSQNPELKNKLLETEDSLIAEASPFDKKWGIGLSVSDPLAYDPSKWKGRNLLGEMLMLVRGILRYSEYDLESVDIPDLEEWGCSRMDCYYDLDDTENPILKTSCFDRYNIMSKTTSDAMYDNFVHDLCNQFNITWPSDFMYSLNLAFEAINLDYTLPTHNLLCHFVHKVYRANDIWGKIYVGDRIN